MFLIERLIGVGFFTVVLIVMCAIISSCKSKEKMRLALFSYTLILSVMGFFYVPYETADLYRIYATLGRYEVIDFLDFFEKYKNSSTIVANFYYWIVSKTGEYRLLPAITAFIGYSCIFYTVLKTAIIYKISPKNVALSVFFIISAGFYMGLISGIRSTLATCLLAFCFFREMVEKKFKVYDIAIYLIAAFMHNFAVVIIFVRLIIPLFSRNMKKRQKIVYSIFLLVFSVFAVRNMSNLLESVFEKANEYINGEMYSYTWGYVICVLVILAILYSLYHFYKISKEEVTSVSQTTILSIVLILISLVFCFEYSIFARTSNILLPMIYIPCFMISLEKNKSKQFHDMMLIICSVIMLISFTRGSICSYKFFVI